MQSQSVPVCPQLPRSIMETCRPLWVRQKAQLLSCCGRPKAEGHLSGQEIRYVHYYCLFYTKHGLLKVYIVLSSTYQVVVEEETGKKVKRELGLQDCFPLPLSHGEAQARGAPHYYTAELPPSSLPEASPFTVGDNHTYNGYWNSPLDPRKSYLVFFQAMSNFRGVSDCKLVLAMQHHFLLLLYALVFISLHQWWHLYLLMLQLAL